MAPAAPCLSEQGLAALYFWVEHVAPRWHRQRLEIEGDISESPGQHLRSILCVAAARACASAGRGRVATGGLHRWAVLIRKDRAGRADVVMQRCRSLLA